MKGSDNLDDMPAAAATVDRDEDDTNTVVKENKATAIESTIEEGSKRGQSVDDMTSKGKDEEETWHDIKIGYT